MTNVAQTVGANVRRLRRNRGLSLVELGLQAGVAKGTLTQLEAGRGNPTLETVQALGAALGVTVADLVTAHADDTPLVVRAGEGTPVYDGPLDARLIRRGHTAGAVTELYHVQLGAGQRSDSPGHPYGVIEQAFALGGSIVVGPVDATVTLRPHDFAQYPADRPHRYEAIDEPAGLLLWMTFPSFSLGSAPFPTRRPPVRAPERPRTAPPQIPARGTRPTTRPPRGRG